MKYRNLKIRFTIENTQFTILSIGLEKMIRPIPKHSHSKNSYELHYISYGYGTLIANDTEYEITPGTFFMTGPGVTHEQISLPSDPMTEYGVYLQVNFPGSRISGEKQNYMPDFLNCDFWIGTAENSMHELMKQIFNELEQQPYGYELMLPPLLLQLILIVTRLYKRDEKISDAQVSSTLPPDDLIYLTIEEAFLYDFKTLTLEKLAGLVCLGPRQTERLLKKHYNKTFQQKKTEARMSAAGLLLQNSDKSINTIAEELGYSSAQHFSNAFKNYYQMTPAAYRKAGHKP